MGSVANFDFLKKKKKLGKKFENFFSELKKVFATKKIQNRSFVVHDMRNLKKMLLIKRISAKKKRSSQKF